MCIKHLSVEPMFGWAWLGVGLLKVVAVFVGWDVEVLGGGGSWQKTLSL